MEGSAIQYEDAPLFRARRLHYDALAKLNLMSAAKVACSLGLDLYGNGPGLLSHLFQLLLLTFKYIKQHQCLSRSKL